jgi:hypothetical protein
MRFESTTTSLVRVSRIEINCMAIIDTLTSDVVADSALATATGGNSEKPIA